MEYRYDFYDSALLSTSYFAMHAYFASWLQITPISAHHARDVKSWKPEGAGLVAKVVYVRVRVQE